MIYQGNSKKPRDNQAVTVDVSIESKSRLFLWQPHTIPVKSMGRSGRQRIFFSGRN